MRTIAHISDIHFGRTDPAVLSALTQRLRELNADLLVVSGDLTQRARRREFAEAKTFLDSLRGPKVVVPGNHDIPVWNVFHRFFEPFKKYGEFLGSDREPSYIDDEMAVAGINSARSLVIKGGRVNEQQIERVRQMMCGVDEHVLKIIVTHHPFDLPQTHTADDIVGRAKKMMPRLAECGADVFLAGHLHVSSVTHSAQRYRMASGFNALIIQAGTAASTRGRGEANSFNLLEFDRPVLTVHRYECIVRNEGFKLATTEQFTQTGVGWERM
jgi:3',5'-cyclic AMP phosphodiesterase CpdA